MQIQDQLNWNYKSLPPCTTTVTAGCLTNVATCAGFEREQPGVRAMTTHRSSMTCSADTGKRRFSPPGIIDLIPKVLTVTAGTRYYEFANSERGSVTGSFFCYEAGPAPCLNYSTNIDAEHLQYDPERLQESRNVTWHFLPDALVYYTWSQGFRPGRFQPAILAATSRSAGNPAINLYCSPLSYTSDNLTNNELGWKTEFFNQHLQWNGAVYQENWNNVQVQVLRPGRTR